ncbi:MAG: biopolymer transporter ExbD [Planctomycetaceae bacterium]|nr:biopolymer transporter ExbD [Planctomycetaceae bacterium]
MRLPSQSYRRSPIRFNITPLIDVVFLLIIFFLAASHFARSEASTEIRLPDSSRGYREDEATPFRVTITVLDDSSRIVGGKHVSDQALRTILQQVAEDAVAANAVPEIRLRVDRNAVYGDAKSVILMCTELKLQKLQFAVVSE